MTQSTTPHNPGQHTDDLPPHGLKIVTGYWPHLILGTLVAMAILGVNPDTPGTVSPLIWVPPAALLSWVALNVVFAPRAPKSADEIIYDADWVDDDEINTSQHVALTAADGGDLMPAAVPAEDKEQATAAPAAAGSADGELVGYNGVVILWGSETGTAEGLAGMTQSKLSAAGIDAKSMDIGTVSLNGLTQVKRILLLTSTWGDGEPPSNAIPIWEAMQKQKVDLSAVGFSVLSLGDTAYTQFCQCGKDFDSFLEKQGAKRLSPRVDCDLDYEANFDKWISAVTQALQANPVTA